MDADANSALRQAANALSAVMAKQRPYSVVAAEDSVILFLRPEHFACLYHTELMPKLRYECTNAWRLRAGVPDVVCGSPRCCRTASLLATRLPTMPLWQPKKYAGLKQKSSVTYERSLLATATTAKSVHLLSSRQPPPPPLTLVPRSQLQRRPGDPTPPPPQGPLLDVPRTENALQYKSTLPSGEDRYDAYMKCFKYESKCDRACL